MRRRLTTILLAAGLSVSMMCGTAYASSSDTAATESVAEVQEAATEAEELESEVAQGSTAAAEASVKAPRNVTGDGVYAMYYESIESSIEQTLAQISQLDDDQIASYEKSTDENTKHLVAAWDQARDGLGAFESVDYYDVDEADGAITFALNAKYTDAEKLGSKVTVNVVYDMAAQSTTYTWDVKETLGRSMAAAAENTVIGILTVTLVLLFLAWVISLFKFIPNGESKKQKELAAAQAAAPVAPAGDEPEEEDVTDDAELVAVITAAIAASEESAPAEGFVVRSIRRRGRRTGWKA